jgi:CBS domain-containing protein
MGRLDADRGRDSAEIRAFTKAILRDLKALERMLSQGMIESGVRRFGVEQEFFLVDRGWRPAAVALDVLEHLPKDTFTTELALFNLEANLQPKLLTGRCFSAMEVEIEERIAQARAAAQREGADVVLCGILPTLGKSDLSMDSITPMPRYYALNDALNRIRGGSSYRLRIEGTDEIFVEHDSVMVEACNTSYQVHLQVSAEEFPSFYNVAQLVTPPVLAACVNSPLLFGKRLWNETRIALFEQSMDTRSATPHLRQTSTRVRFGERWIRKSVTELFEDDIARFRVLLTGEVTEDPFEVLARGGVPRLPALQLHNGTVYRWNRPCYGISEGKPHLRIECRVLPSGPTIMDEVANAAFWIGLVLGGAREYGDVASRVDFDYAKSNFVAASRRGLDAGFHWLTGETVSARDLLLGELLPLSRSGLEELGIEPTEIDHYLGIVQGRVESGMTGATWQLKSLRGMTGRGSVAESMTALTSGMAHRQRDPRPAHNWEPAEIWEAGGWRYNYLKVEQYMVTDLFTVHEDEPIELAAFLMDKQNIRHVLVENDDHTLVGLVSYRSILRMVAASGAPGTSESDPIRTIMASNVVTVEPETSTLEAIKIMREKRVSALPVEKNGKLIGIISERDFLPIAYQLLEERLEEV